MIFLPPDGGELTGPGVRSAPRTLVDAGWQILPENAFKMVMKLYSQWRNEPPFDPDQDFMPKRPVNCCSIPLCA